MRLAFSLQCQQQSILGAGFADRAGNTDHPCIRALARSSSEVAQRRQDIRYQQQRSILRKLPAALDVPPALRLAARLVPLSGGKLVGRTLGSNRLLAVEEGPRTGGWATGLLGAVAEQGLHDLDDVWIIATDETPIPYSPTLEDAFMPDTEAIVASVRARAGIGVA